MQSPTAQICALGLRQCLQGEKGATINGVIFPAAEDMSTFDVREAGYQRALVCVLGESIEQLKLELQVFRAKAVIVFVVFQTSAQLRSSFWPLWCRSSAAKLEQSCLQPRSG